MVQSKDEAKGTPSHSHHTSRGPVNRPVRQKRHAHDHANNHHHCYLDVLTHQAQPLCHARQKTTRTRTPSVGLRSNRHSQARQPPCLVHERSHVRVHARSVPAPPDFVARVRMRAESAPSLQHFQRRHAILVLSPPATTSDTPKVSPAT